MKFTAKFLHKAFPKTHTISLQDAKDRKLFGPVYHGTSSENWSKIDTEGFKVIEGETGSAGVSNGYEGTREYAAGVPAPVHHLGYGVYFTTSPTIAKMFNGGTAKGLRTYYLDVPRLETINFAATNTMMKWWIKMGYNPDVARRDRVTATKLLTENLKSQFDAVWFKGKTLRKTLDGDQVCVYDPSRIYEIDKKLAKPGDIGSKVKRKSDGMKGTILNIRTAPVGRYLEIKWDKGGKEWNAKDEDVEFL
jgi:hypothetical protein